MGGIQVVQEELCARLDSALLSVIAADHEGAVAFDATLPYEVQRVPARTLLPTRGLAARVAQACERVKPDVVVFGSALPLGLLRGTVTGRGIPYVVMVYGADVSVPARLPGTRAALKAVLAGAAGVVALGPFVAAEVRRVPGPAWPDPAGAPRCGHRALRAGTGRGGAVASGSIATGRRSRA